MTTELLDAGRLGTDAGVARDEAELSASLHSAKIAIVDDEIVNIRVVKKHLELNGYSNFITTTNAEEAADTIDRERPDILLLDLMMPRVSGMDILDIVKANPATQHLPVVILTASTDSETKREALEHGAADFIAKPIDINELLVRIRNVLTVKAHHDFLLHHAEKLKEEVKRQTHQLEMSRFDVIHRLARAAEYRDNETGRHVMRVGKYAGLIARTMGLGDEFVEMITHTSPLHDVGKIGIPDGILLKPGRLTPEEFDVMQSHAAMGKRIFERISDEEAVTLMGHAEIGSRILGGSDCELLEMAATIAATHHEKWDGSGYPLALAGEDIPIEGRITAVADVFDALSTKRPYKPAFPLEKCFQILIDGRGSHFDPAVLDAFLSKREEIVAIQIKYSDDI